MKSKINIMSLLEIIKSTFQKNPFSKIFYKKRSRNSFNFYLIFLFLVKNEDVE